MKTALQFIFGAIAGIAAAVAGATAQIPDQLLIDGKAEPLFSEPLLSAFRANPHLQQNLMRRIPDAGCSASWRGYLATWEVRDKTLYLTSIELDPCSSRVSVPLAELFPGVTGPVKAVWFTGTLTVPQGEQVEYVHMGYESRYERYLYLQVEKGKVTKRTSASGAPTHDVPVK
jgi:hypothetical protein